jgi:Leucine-rich repeat (LRR) protein
LKNPEALMLGFNQIDDISALANMTKLKALWLEGNQIDDLSPAAHVPSVDVRQQTQGDPA